MVLIDQHEIHGNFLTIPINNVIVGWSMHQKGGSPNFIGHKGTHLILLYGAASENRYGFRLFSQFHLLRFPL